MAPGTGAAVGRARAVRVEPGAINAAFHIFAEVAARRPPVRVLLAVPHCAVFFTELLIGQLALLIRGDLLIVGRAGVAGACQDDWCVCAFVSEMS